MRGGDRGRVLALHLGVVALLAGLQVVLPPFHHGMLARIMVLAAYAVGYNVLLGYTGLMSLGHAMFFAAGMYGTGLTVHHLGFGVGAGFLAGALAGLVVAGLVGLMTLRTTGPAFLIVTMMLAQAFYLATLYWNDVTGGDQGFILTGLHLHLAGRRFALAEPAVKYNVALGVFAACLLVSLWLTRSPVGRVLVAVRENEERTRLLGYNTYRYRFLSVLLSGLLASVAGAAYTLLFSYVGSTFAGILYSIYPLLWTLLGGAGTVLGPLVGTLAMTYIVDVTSGFTTGYLLVVGTALVVMVLWAPAGIVGGIPGPVGPMAPVTPLLETRGLSKRFGGLEAVQAVDFRLERGEVRALIGPNGAGKTTLVGLISGRLRPSAGEVRFAGRDITGLRAWERAVLGIVYTFQVTSIYRQLSVHDNVALAAQRGRLKAPRDWIRLDDGAVAADVQAALARVGLTGPSSQRAGELAYGHQRVLEVAMALALGPALLILDEPTQGLAGDEIEALCRLVRDLAGTTTILLIEHNMPVVLELAGRVTVMDRGRILAEGTPGEIEAHPDVQRAYLGR